jgi:tripeptide aminopeptidase
MLMDRERLLARFLRYVAIETTANDAAGTYPSSPGQLELGRLLVDELRAVGLAESHQDRHGLVHATLAATATAPAPHVVLNAHLDTSPEASGRNVRPQVIRDYAGGDLVLPGAPSEVIRVADNPELATLRGKTLITTDGTTLLGSDDKAGVAVIMELVEHLQQHPEVSHGAIRVLFTCDEEIGHGVAHVDVAGLGAAVAYTLDGFGAAQIDVETFSADLATLVFHGRNIHPSIAKGRMVNAVRAASQFAALIPRTCLAPEVTADRQGFLHPYQLAGGVGDVTMKVLLRDFDTAQLEGQATLLRDLARAVRYQFPGLEIDITITAQYRNMADGLVREPRAVRLAEQAHQQLGRPAQRMIVRGGTDGSQFTAQGLPTPNLSTGQHNPHSPLEWACLDEMYYAVEHLVELVKLWGLENVDRA